jgi:hypothetical protein
MILTSMTSCLFSKKTRRNTTLTMLSDVTKLTKKREASIPRCQCKHSPRRKLNLPFSDLQHDLIKGAGSRHHDDSYQTKEEKKKKRSTGRFGKPRPHWTCSGSSTQRSSTKLTTTLVHQKSPSGCSGVRLRLSNKESRSRFGSEPRSSRSNWSGLRRPWICRPSLTLN